MAVSRGFLCMPPAKLLQRVRNSCCSSKPESSRMHSGKPPRRLPWLALPDMLLPDGVGTGRTHKVMCTHQTVLCAHTHACTLSHMQSSRPHTRTHSHMNARTLYWMPSLKHLDRENPPSGTPSPTTSDRPTHTLHINRPSKPTFIRWPSSHILLPFSPLPPSLSFYLFT